MANSLYNLALDFSKELNYTKAIMARQGDKGITVTVKPFLNGLQMDTSGGTFILKGTTPSNRYVDSIATSVNSEEVTFSLDSTFMSEAGYYKNCYVEYRKDNQILTTQDIIFFSLGVSDISQGQADKYVSQLEALIEQYNLTFEEFMKEIEGQVTNLKNDLSDMDEKTAELKKQLDQLQEDIISLDLDSWKKEVLEEGNQYTDSKYSEVEKNFVKQEILEKGPLVFKNTQITTQDWNDIQDVGIYYCAGSSGENMPTSGPLYGYLTVKKITTVTQQTFETGLSVYIRSLTGNPQTWSNWHEIALTEKTVNLSEDQEVDGTKNFLKQPLFNGNSLAQEVFGVTLHGGKLEGVPVKDGTILNWGEPYSYDNERSKSNDLFTVSEDTKTLTILKDCTLQFIGKFTCQTNHADYYAYLGMRVNGGNDWRAAGIGGNLNWRNDVGWIMVREFKTGDEVTLVTGTNYSTDSVNAWGVDQVYIKEVIRA